MKVINIAMWGIFFLLLIYKKSLQNVYIPIYFVLYMKLFLKSIMILASVVLLATLVLADPPYNTGGTWTNGGGIHKVTAEVTLANSANGDINVKIGDETIKLNGGWDSDSSEGAFKDGMRVRVRCDRGNCWLEIKRDGAPYYVRMTYVPKPVPVDKIFEQ